MRIDGRKIAEEIRKDLKSEIADLKLKNITPKLAIITLGPESSWESYVNQKIKVADELGIKAVLINLSETTEENLLKIIGEIDSDPNYHGIIVQRPLPKYIDRAKVIEAISPQKDIDGFRPDSNYEVPVWLAVKKILYESLSLLNKPLDFSNYKITVLGKGETAGSPITQALLSLGASVNVIDSKTNNPEEVIKSSDIVISCVGKSEVITPGNLKDGVILVGVGTHGEDGGIRGDYKAAEIKDVAAAFTTTPGGVGPVNLSYLFSNLIESAND